MIDVYKRQILYHSKFTLISDYNSADILHSHDISCLLYTSGYQAVYGQLTDLTVSEGDTIKKGTTIGYIAQPTKYYLSLIHI